MSDLTIVGGLDPMELQDAVLDPGIIIVFVVAEKEKGRDAFLDMLFDTGNEINLGQRATALHELSGNECGYRKGREGE